MNDDYNAQLSDEDLARILPEKRHQEDFRRLLEHMKVDRAATAALKGHLLLEEKLTSIIEQFVFHAEKLDGARLTFSQKLSIARSISLDQHNNSIWDVISSVNSLRNALSHSLQDGRRKAAIDLLRANYLRQMGRELQDWEEQEEGLIIGAVALSQGFLGACEQEVERFRAYVNKLDQAVNHKRFPPKDEGPQ